MSNGFKRQLSDELAREDEQTRHDRLERAIFVMRQGEPEDGWLFMGMGVVGPWNELRVAYIAGCYQAALLVGQACLENLLGSALDFPDKRLGKVALSKLLEVALAKGVLLKREYELFDRLRKDRNPLAHYRPFGHPESATELLMWRQVPVEELARQDCEEFVAALYAFVHRRFGCGPVCVHAGLEEVAPSVHPDQLELYPVEIE